MQTIRNQDNKRMNGQSRHRLGSSRGRALVRVAKVRDLNQGLDTFLTLLKKYVTNLNNT